MTLFDVAKSKSDSVKLLESAPDMEVTISDDKLKQAFRDWLEDQKQQNADGTVSDLDPEMKDFLAGVFKEGWAACMESVFPPAINLCLLFMRMARISLEHGAPLELSPQSIAQLAEFARGVIGDVDMNELVQDLPDVDISNPVSSES